MEETRTDGGSVSGNRPQKQKLERLGKGVHGDSVGWTYSEDNNSSPSGATLKRLKLKVGGLATNTLHLTPGHRPSPEVTPQSLPAGKFRPFQASPPLEGHRRTVAPNLDFPASETKSAKRKRRAIVENSDDESLERDDTDYSDSDSPPPVRKRTPLPRPEEPPADRSGTQQAFREKRSPKPKVIWDPNDGGGRDMRGEKSKKAAESKGTPNSARKLKRLAEDPGEEGFSRKAEQDVPGIGAEGFGVSPPRERRLSKPRVIWDPDDDDDRELLRVVSKSAEPRGPVSPKVHTSPRQHVSPKQGSKKVNKASAYEREGFREPASEISNSETLGQKASPLAIPMPPGKTRQAFPSVQIDSLRLPTALHLPHTGAYSPHPGSATRGGEYINRSELGSPNLAPAMSPGKRKKALGGGLGSPQGLGVLPGSRSPPGFKVPSGKSCLQNTEQLHVRGDWKGDGTAEGGRKFQPMEAQHEVASPGKRLSDKKRLREDTEAERQLKKEERARKRKAETEKAAREVQASAIQKILGQESTRKKREEAVQKRRDAKEEKRLASGNEAPSDMVRVTDNASGVTLVWPATVPFPVELEQAPRDSPPARPKCSAPECRNSFRYRDSKSLLPLCSLQCYKAVRTLQQSGLHLAGAMVNVTTGYLILQQSVGVPDVVKTFLEEGGDPTKVVVLHWHYPYVGPTDKPKVQVVSGVVHVYAGVTEVQIQDQIIRTDSDIMISYKELVIGLSPESSQACARGLMLGDKGITFLRTRQGTEQWVKRALQGQGNEDSEENELVETYQRRLEQYGDLIGKEITAATGVTDQKLKGKNVARKIPNIPVIKFRLVKRRIIKIIRESGETLVTDYHFCTISKVGIAAVEGESLEFGCTNQ